MQDYHQRIEAGALIQETIGLGFRLGQHQHLQGEKHTLKEATRPLTRYVVFLRASLIRQLKNEYAWIHLGPEGHAISKILKGIKPRDQPAILKRWEAHLGKVLRFPFEAEVAEFQERGPIPTDAKVMVRSMTMVDEMRGIIVEVAFQNNRYYFPLCDLEAVDKNSDIHDYVIEYAVWYANR